MANCEQDWSSPFLIDAGFKHGADDGYFTPGKGAAQWFKDHSDSPRMVVVPAGRCTIGSPACEQHWPGYDGREEPQREISISQPFAVGAAPVTRGEFAAFMAATGYRIEGGAFVWRSKRRWRWWIKSWQLDPRINWLNPGFAQSGEHPVVCVSWDDAKAYAQWLCKASGGLQYRLLSEAEWEYCCRAGTSSAFSTGETISEMQANFGANHVTTPVGLYPPNGWGLYDMHGNVWEWVEDDWHPNYRGDPPCDGSAWRGGDEVLRGLRGGRWDDGQVHFRSADRGRGPRWLRNCVVGFRIARSLQQA